MNAEPSHAHAASGERSPGVDVPWSVTFPSCVESLAATRERVRQHLHESAVDDTASYAVDFALEELAGNTLRYGYEAGNEGVIRVEIAVAPSLVQLVITDDARPFDPTLHPEPNRPQTLGDAPIGGRGISMVRRLVRAMRYRREAGRNRLEVDVARTLSG